MNWLFSVIAVGCGIALGVQAAINGGLGKRVGALEGAFISFAVGTIVIWLIMVVFGKGSVSSIWAVPKWQLTGGLLGAFYVCATVVLVPKVGVASVLIAVIFGQLLTGAIIDHFAWFGGKHIPLDGRRILALCLMAAAVYIFYRK